MSKERLVPQTRKRLRNLKQFAEMTDDEFEDYFQEFKESAVLDSEEMEIEVNAKLSQFDDDYDLSDMKINDRLVLRNLIVSMVTLEKLEITFTRLQTNISDSNILLLDRLAGIMSKLRKDISDMQSDLKLTRKIRKEGQEEDFLSWMDKMRARASEYWREKLLYIFCPECSYLLANAWLLFPQEDAVLKLKCGRESCRHEFEVRLNDLYETQNKNLDSVALPI